MRDEILQATDRGLEVFKSFLSGNFKQVGKAFKNPFYLDNNASCYVFLDKETNTYKFKDFGDPLFFGDCFSLVVQIPVKLTTSDRSKLTTNFTGEDFIFLL